MKEIIDTHSHIQFPAYDHDREAVIERMRAAEVKTIAIGTRTSTSETAIAAARKFPEEIIGASVGFHPGAEWLHDKNELLEPVPENFDIEHLSEIAKEPEVVAIGECGLDYFRIEKEQLAKTKEKQEKTFRAQIELARELGKPLIIHCREAFEDLGRILSSYGWDNGKPKGIVHFFSGTGTDAEKLIALGFYIAFGGVITFTKEYDQLVKEIPLQKIVLETDAPYVSPAPYRGKRNEPQFVIEVAKRMADLKSEDFELVAEKTAENAKKIFGLK